jgi:hypothetical protein
MHPEATEAVLRLCAIQDLKQRSHALAARLEDLADEVVVDLVKIIQDEAMQGHPQFRALYSALTVSSVLNEVLGEKKMSRLVAEAQRRQEFGVVSILMDVESERQEDIPFQPFLDSSLREVPLGMRKSLARKPDFKLIQRIARDQDHRVIEHLLDNPRLTETDVIKIGSTRPTSPKVLEVIYNHRRWITRYSVKKVIVFNPHSPLSMAVRLLTYMQSQDLDEIIASPDLDPVLIDEAERIRQKKGNSELSLEHIEI